MLSGSMYRTRNHEKTYAFEKRSRKTKPCPFCTIREEGREPISKSKYFLRIKNIFPFDTWDGYQVKAHELIIPKRHVTGLDALTAPERKELIDLLCKADKEGYDTYARHDGNEAKTVAHQHTHLIKTAGKPITHLVYVRKPHMLLVGKNHR